jgi:O-antigen/teichoic acid export membrane protein
MTEDLVRKTGRGIGWNLLSQGAQQTVRFVVIVVLTKFLSPSDFGVFAMTLVFTELIRPFREWGFQAALIQKENLDAEYLNTAFWAVCGLALVLFAVSLAFAPWIGMFFHEPMVAQMIPVIGGTFLMSPFGSVQWALSSKNLDFRTIAFVDATSVLCYGVAACWLAGNGFGVWSLVWATVLREFVWSIHFWLLHPWRPALSFCFKKFKELSHFSMHCMGTGFLNYSINYFDFLMAGRALGPAPLGFYNLAVNTTSKPETRIVSQVVSAVFPAYSMIQGDPERIREAHLTTLRAIATITAPLLAILFVAAPDFVAVFFSEKWTPAVLPIQIMCFSGFLKALASVTHPVFLSKGRPDLEMKLTLFGLAVFVVCVSVGLRYGIVGVSVGVLVFSMVNFVPTFFLADRLLGLSHGRSVGIVLKYILLAVAVIGLLKLAGTFVPRGYPGLPLARLALQCVFGGFAYLMLWFVFFRQEFYAVLMLLIKNFRPRNA